MYKRQRVQIPADVFVALESQKRLADRTAVQIHLIAKFFDDLEVVRTVRFVKYQSFVANLDDQIGILTGTVGEVLENRKRRILNPHIVSRRPTERDEGGTCLLYTSCHNDIRHYTDSVGKTRATMSH